MRYDRWSYIWSARPRTAIPFAKTARCRSGTGTGSGTGRGSPAHLVRARFACGRWVVLDSEPLHSRHASVKNTVYMFGALVLEGEYLLCETYGSAYGSLPDRSGRPPDDVEGCGGFVADMGGGLWPASISLGHHTCPTPDVRMSAATISFTRLGQVTIARRISPQCTSG